MLKKLGINKMIEAKTAAGIEIVLLADNVISINVVLLKKVKSSVAIEKQQAGITSIEELASFLDPKQPFVLVVNGKGIVHRKITLTENDTSLTLLNKLLPNANLNEFEIQQTAVDESHALISVIRSTSVSQLIDELTSKKLTNMADCLLGPFAVSNIIPLLQPSELLNNQFRFSNYQLQLEENEIKDITVTQEQNTGTVQVGDNTINSQLLVAFAAALSYFTGNHNGINDSVLVQALKEEFRQKQKFELRGASLLIASFCILLINYFVFEHFWTKNGEMEAVLTSNQSALMRYDTLKAQLSLKKEFLERNGLLENSRTSFYADQLAAALPASIQWTDVNIHPLMKKKADEEQEIFSFENKTIRISGKCQKTTELNNWMKLIKEKNWIAGVTLTNYTRHNETEDGLFLLEVNLRN